METLYTSNGRISNGNEKCAIGKSIFAVNLELKVLLIYSSYSDTAQHQIKYHHVKSHNKSYYLWSVAWATDINLKNRVSV